MKSARTSRGWARVATAVLAGALAFGLTACGSDDDDAGSSGESVTITHARGETTITGTPERVVVLGNQWLDTALALGVQPVGYVDNIAVLGGAAPAWQPAMPASAKQLNAQGNVVEQVAALEPDLILADAFIADQNQYGQLSKIAPTLPGLSQEVVAPWADLVTTLGKVLHKPDAATGIINGVNAKIDAAAAANPGLRGKTFASTFLFSPTQLMVLTDPKDGSTELFTKLGLSIPKNITDLPANGGRAALSPERADQLTADLLLAGYTVGMDEKYRQLPGYADLPAVRKDSVVFMNQLDISAINQPTALSIPYILDKLAPALANAAK